MTAQNEEHRVVEITTKPNEQEWMMSVGSAVCLGAHCVCVGLQLILLFVSRIPLLHASLLAWSAFWIAWILATQCKDVNVVDEGESEKEYACDG
jgi:hypothetical protein